jgi:hypothetical protein
MNKRDELMPFNLTAQLADLTITIEAHETVWQVFQS